MKKMLSIALLSSLAFSSTVMYHSPLEVNKTTEVTAAAKYKLVNGTLRINKKPYKRVASGYVTFKGKIYQQGKLFTGNRLGYYYSKGVKANGTFGIHIYKNGVKTKLDINKYPYDEGVTVTKAEKQQAIAIQKFIDTYKGKANKNNYKFIMSEVERLRIVVDGLTPDTYGKTLLARDLAEVYQGAWLIENPFTSSTDDIEF